jgi:N-acetylneuraminic acid mutarotase
MNDPSMTVLADGNVFVCGGRMYNGDVLKTAYILDTKTMHWRAAAKMQRGRMEHVCVTMPDGSVMIIGGRTTNTGTNNMFVPFIYMNAVDVYYPDKDEWCVEHSIVPFYKTEHACALLPNNKLLIFGGTDAGCTNSYSYLYDISARTWSVAPKIPQFVGDQKKPFAHALVYQ